MEKDLAIEAKHSMAVLAGMFGGKLSGALSGICTKYPDILDALLMGDLEAYKKHISVVIVVPIKIIAEALAKHLQDETMKTQIEEISKKAEEDPYGVKKNLIRLSNVMIFNLNSRQKMNMAEIGERKRD
jgi:hypothetical protein